MANNINYGKCRYTKSSFSYYNESVSLPTTYVNNKFDQNYVIQTSNQYFKIMLVLWALISYWFNHMIH